MPLSDDITNELGRQFDQEFGDIDDIINQCTVDRVGGDQGEGGSASTNPSDTAQQSYNTVRYGTNEGSISFGVIHEKADVKSAVMLRAPDGRHQVSLDSTGQRKGWTTITAPGNVQVLAGMDNKEAQETLFLSAENGNIRIIASNGKIRLQGTDIELIAVGEGGSKGNIRLSATENIDCNSKKFLVDAKVNYKIATPGTGEIISNGILKMYGSVIKGVSDAVAVKDSKCGGKNYQQKQNQV